MNMIVHKLASTACLVAILHLTIADMVMAQTSDAMRNAASQANTNTFKPDASALYGDTSNPSSIEIIGASPNGNVSFAPSELYYGLEGKSDAAGQLPEINTYEQLYSHRDTRVEQLERGSGEFSSTGGLNAEAAAMDVLRGTRNTPSVAKDKFLKLSRDLLSDRKSIENEFGSCIIQTVAGENTTTYEDYYTETCDRFAVDTTPINATRTYSGPDHIFNYTVVGGVGYCEWNGRRIRTDARETCGKLSIMREIPSNSGGSLSVRSCSGAAQCVEIVLEQYPTQSPVTTTFTVSPRVDVTQASVYANGIEQAGFASYQGAVVLGANGGRNMPEVTSSEGHGQVFGIYAGNTRRDPQNGSYLDSPGQAPPNTGFYQKVNYGSGNRPNTNTGRIRWQGVDICSGNCYNGAYHDGWYYYPDTGNRGAIENGGTWFGVWRSKSTRREPMSGELFEYRTESRGDDTYYYPISQVVNESNDSGRWIAAEFYWQGTRVGRITSNPNGTLTVGNCTYYTGSSQENHYGRLAIYRICEVDVPSYASLVIQLRFNATVFSAWTYPPDRWADIQRAVAAGLVTISYEVMSSVTNGNGCVFSYAGSSGRLGELCGADIPVAPFNRVPDRGATQIAIRPVYSSIATGDGENAYTEYNTCTPLEQNPACTFLNRECLDDAGSAACSAYEYTYSCGKTLSYTYPSYSEINICNSALSCLGDDCILNTGSDGSVDLADAAAKLAAVDMILSDMQCTIDPSAANVENEMMACQLFSGTGSNCMKVTLGLANCCTNAKGVNLADYLQLAFAASRVSRVVEGSVLANPITSSWVGMENLARDSFSKLTRPITESWESIIGNSGVTGQGAGALSMEAVKQGMMKNVAQWTSNIFGEQAANAIFQVGGSPALVRGSIQPGTIGLTSGAASVMSAVMTAYSIYALASVLIEILFTCSKSEQELQVRKALRSTHEVGSWCSTKILGKCVKRKTGYCMFNSPLARIMNEQARLQMNIGWGLPEKPDCRGITLAEFQHLDMDRVDLSEWTGMLASSGMLDMSSLSNIDNLTGNASTLGRAQADLYPRENAIDRNTNRFDNIDLDALRNDAVNDFGMGVVQ